MPIINPLLKSKSDNNSAVLNATQLQINYYDHHDLIGSQIIGRDGTALQKIYSDFKISRNPSILAIPDGYQLTTDLNSVELDPDFQSTIDLSVTKSADYDYQMHLLQLKTAISDIKSEEKYVWYDFFNLMHLLLKPATYWHKDFYQLEDPATVTKSVRINSLFNFLFNNITSDLKSDVNSNSINKTAKIHSSDIKSDTKQKATTDKQNIFSSDIKSDEKKSAKKDKQNKVSNSKSDKNSKQSNKAVKSSITELNSDENNTAKEDSVEQLDLFLTSDNNSKGKKNIPDIKSDAKSKKKKDNININESDIKSDTNNKINKNKENNTDLNSDTNNKVSKKDDTVTVNSSDLNSVPDFNKITVKDAKSYLILNSDQIKKDKEMKDIIVTKLNSDKRKGMQKLVKTIK